MLCFPLEVSGFLFETTLFTVLIKYGYYIFDISFGQCIKKLSSIRELNSIVTGLVYMVCLTNLAYLLMNGSLLVFARLAVSMVVSLAIDHLLALR